ncbi:hypothetical protein LPW11_02000 [Geomonas sp. RF6]|uniref:hypothetical protein n=1 Tax=Geomonas sp. RF6 TaxID=2897342 RepID=UPI001E4440F3|nr:hypothetical protein [Geomonas sp. RF6]UFS70970.1 hypothetical protein LPW11_02000 [Geomonas sp. RF6]
MAGKIFYRERVKRGQDGSKSPRYVVMATSGTDLKVHGQHFRMSEMKHMAESVGAELIHLERGQKHQGEAEGETTA